MLRKKADGWEMRERNIAYQNDKKKKKEVWERLFGMTRVSNFYRFFLTQSNKSPLPDSS